MIIVLRTLALLPLIIISLVLILGWIAERSIRREIKKAGHLPCPKCKNPVGLQVLQEARRNAKGPLGEDSAHGNRIIMRRRFLARWDFLCPQCNAPLSIKPSDWAISIRPS